MIVDTLDEISSVTSSLAKVAILKRDMYEGSLLESLMCLVYNPRIIFGITSSQINRGNFWVGTDDNIPIDVLQKLPSEAGRIEKSKLVESNLNGKSERAVRYFLRALDKDLNIGINAKTINKASPGLIDLFELMLAHKQTEKDFLANFSDTDWVYANLKIDGIRCACMIGKEVKFYTRDGKEVENFLIENIRKDIMENFSTDLYGFTLDGEIYSNKFQELMRVVNRKKSDAISLQIRNTCRFAVFDIFPTSVYLQGDVKIPLSERVKTLEARVARTKFVHTVTYHRIKTHYELLFKLSRKLIRQGHEGIIIKHPNSHYMKKRSKMWLKFKDKRAEDLRIVDVFEGDKGTKYEGLLGGIVLDLGNGNQVRCGSGFTDGERKELWMLRDTLLGKTAQVSFMEKTDDGSLRHPVFECIRSDK